MILDIFYFIFEKLLLFPQVVVSFFTPLTAPIIAPLNGFISDIASFTAEVFGSIAGLQAILPLTLIFQVASFVLLVEILIINKTLLFYMFALYRWIRSLLIGLA